MNVNRAKNNVAHGIMFHHFYDEKHVCGQGAISSEQFERIIEFYGDDLLPADQWFDKAKNNTLSEKDVCLTFDDGLLCQYDVALPVLEKYNLTAFWFVYSSALEGIIENIEVYRKFRTVCFSDIDDFYDKFFSILEKTEYNEIVNDSLSDYSHDNWSHFPFYSRNDTKFRYIRDVSLGSEKYNYVMDEMMKVFDIDLNEFSSDLWMNNKHIQDLDGKGHIIGLHSHSHPTQLSKLSEDGQKQEYQRNYDYLYNLLGHKPRSVSHPCNSYNAETLSILRDLKIEIGFRSNMESHLFSEFEFPREDHVNVLKRIEV